MSLAPSHKNAWIAFVSAHRRLLREIDKRMQESGVVPLDVYDILLILEESPERRLRMTELAEASFFSKSGTTRLVDRLEKEGWVERLACPNDRRAIHVRVTPAGSKERERAWPVYRAAIGELFAAHMSEEEARALSAVIVRMADQHLLIGWEEEK